jgi:hypothetical protein
VLEAPRHPINMQLTGDKLRRNPTKALYMLSVRVIMQIRENLHWCRVTEGLSQFTSNLILRRKVELFEQLG